MITVDNEGGGLARVLHAFWLKGGGGVDAPPPPWFR